MNLENKFASLWVDNGILFFVYKDNVDIDLSAAIEIVSERLELQQGNSYLILCDVRGIRNINIDAREYLASEGSVLSTAVVLISNTPLSKVISDLYLINSTPKVPTKVFTNYNDGLTYLKSLL